MLKNQWLTPLPSDVVSLRQWLLVYSTMHEVNETLLLDYLVTNIHQRMGIPLIDVTMSTIVAALQQGTIPFPVDPAILYKK